MDWFDVFFYFMAIVVVTYSLIVHVSKALVRKSAMDKVDKKMREDEEDKRYERNDVSPYVTDSTSLEYWRYIAGNKYKTEHESTAYIQKSGDIYLDNLVCFTSPILFKKLDKTHPACDIDVTLTKDNFEDIAGYSYTITFQFTNCHWELVFYNSLNEILIYRVNTRINRVTNVYTVFDV